MTTEIYIGSDRLELYERDKISLKSSVADITDISRNFGDYIRDFTVPASDVNNKIFKHYYDYEIDDGFDARVKQSGRIDIGGETFRTGKFYLTKVSVKKGKPFSYTLGFASKLTNLKDLFKSDTLQDLDLSSYDHTYNSTNVKSGLQGSLSSGNIIYTPLTKKQLYINNDGSDSTQTETLSNIGYGGGSGSGLIWSDLIPSIKNTAILSAIETKYSLSFSNNFLNTVEFTNSFLWLNSNKDEEVGGNSQVIDWDGGDDTYMNLTTNIGTYVSNDTFYFSLNVYVTPSSGYEDIPYKIKTYKNGELASELEWTGNGVSILVLSDNGNYNVYYEVEAPQQMLFTASLSSRRRVRSTGAVTTFVTTASEDTITSEFTISENIPKLKVMEWFKAFVNMDKLVVIQGEEETFVDTIDNYYASGDVVDITEYVFADDYTVERGKILNNINFSYEEPSTILNKKFEENNGIPYGDFELFLYEDENEEELLDGEELSIDIPFELILHERLYDQSSQALSNFQYGAVIDEELNAVNPNAVIHYYEPKTVGSVTIGFQNDSGTKEQLFIINLPSNCYPLESPVFSFTFDREINPWNGEAIEYTLYQNHYKATLDEIFNIKKRQLKIKARLPYHILNSLELNDVIEISERYYRINSFEVDVIDGVVDFDLINSLTNTTDIPVISQSKGSFSGDSGTYYIGGSNLTGETVTKTDLGSGTSWATVTIEDGQLKIVLDENTSGLVRYMLIEVGTASIYINQNTDTITIDNDTITIDNDIITIDNG